MSYPAANDYPGFLIEINARIRPAQHQAPRAVNAELLGLYRGRQELQPLVGEISWAKDLVIAAYCQNCNQRLQKSVES